MTLTSQFDPNKSSYTARYTSNTTGTINVTRKDTSTSVAWLDDDDDEYYFYGEYFYRKSGQSYSMQRFRTVNHNRKQYGNPSSLMPLTLDGTSTYELAFIVHNEGTMIPVDMNPLNPPEDSTIYTVTLVPQT